jgi:GH15 family glucan-1,4-alpha-glucosidase
VQTEIVGDERVDGYAPLRGYAAIGDGRTLALVARDGAIDWLCAPEFDGESLLAAVLDAGRGGSATLRPADAFGVERRYLDDTNVLETTFTTSLGVLRITDAMAMDDRRDAPFRTIIRRVECLAGSVDVVWSVAPRFGYGQLDPEPSASGDGGTMAGAGLAARVHVFDLGEPAIDAIGVHGAVPMEAGDRGLLALVVGDAPPPDSARDVFELALGTTARWWRTFTGRVQYDGPWKDAVIRSSLALRLLVSSGTGAIIAAGTTSLPEVEGGVRNWDYRYSWVRDSLLMLDAFFAVGCEHEATAYFEWLRRRLDPSTGRISVLYDLRGAECAPERELALDGWRGARPVRAGNSAAEQYQQSTYGTLLHACHLYASRANGGLPHEQQLTFLRSASLLSRIWHEPDDGIWEERGAPQHHTHSKMMSVLGLHCASDLARQLGDLRLADRLRAASDGAAAFVDSRCVDPATGAYSRIAGGRTFDAAVLMPLGMGYGRWGGPDRVGRTIDTIRERLGNGGALLYRYRDDDGLPGEEGFFMPCSFWLAGALAHCGRLDDAAAVLDDVIARRNDVGIYSEELGCDGAFLGNLPQGITHASLISSAVAVGDSISGSGRANAWGAASRSVAAPRARRSR